MVGWRSASFFCVQKPLGFDAVRGAEGLLFPSLVVVGVEDSSPAKHPVFFPDAHNVLGYERKAVGSRTVTVLSGCRAGVLPVR